MYKHLLKHLFDFLFALLGLIILSPLFLVVVIWLYIANKGAGVFFIHERPGKNGKFFKVLKFKTMTDEKDEAGKLLSDAQRLTKVGRFIRESSIDELPQLINILKGDMSLIGPRPLYVEFLMKYSKEQARRHEIRPGITGWAQVNGRNLMLYSKKFEYDVWYVDHLSLFLDLRIIFMTIKNIFLKKDIGEGNEVTEEVDDLNFGL